MKTSMLSSPCRFSIIFLCKISGALEIPKCRLLKQYLPKGVMNVVKLQLSGCSGICQNPLVASRDEKTVAPLISAVISVEVGKMYYSFPLIYSVFSGLSRSKLLLCVSAKPAPSRHTSLLAVSPAQLRHRPILCSSCLTLQHWKGHLAYSVLSIWLGIIL